MAHCAEFLLQCEAMQTCKPAAFHSDMAASPLSTHMSKFAKRKDMELANFSNAVLVTQIDDTSDSSEAFFSVLQTWHEEFPPAISGKLTSGRLEISTLSAWPEVKNM